MLDAMRMRTSCRSYDGAPLTDGERRGLSAAIAALPAGPFGGRLRARLIEGDEAARLSGLRLGTYGVIRGAPAYLAAAIDDGPRAMEDFGFGFECLVLHATALGLGTCWLGGTLRRGAFGAALGLRPGEVVPCVSPVGHPRAGRRSFIDATFRRGAGSDRRKPWPELFFDGRPGVPLAPAAAGPLERALDLLRRAPSASNRQPWRVVRGGDGALHLLLARSPGYGRFLPFDLQRVDMGIAMSHLALAAAALGEPGAWRALDPPPDLGPLPAGTSYVSTWTPGAPAPTGEPQSSTGREHRAGRDGVACKEPSRFGRSRSRATSRTESVKATPQAAPDRHANAEDRWRIEGRDDRDGHRSLAEGGSGRRRHPPCGRQRPSQPAMRARTHQNACARPKRVARSRETSRPVAAARRGGSVSPARARRRRSGGRGRGRGGRRVRRRAALGLGRRSRGPRTPARGRARWFAATGERGLCRAGRADRLRGGRRTQRLRGHHELRRLGGRLGTPSASSVRAGRPTRRA
jgi:nitroreductase